MMYLQLHHLCIALQSEDGLIKQQWQRLFAQWLLPHAPERVDLCLRLRLVETLPPLPKSPPIFTDFHELPHDLGVLSVYPGEGDGVWLYYRDGAMVAVPMAAASGAEPPTATGVVIPTVFAYGRFEDVTFTSLAPLLRRRGCYLIHAFAASREGQGVLLVGPSGSGKTTTGLSLLLAGWRLLANDIVLLAEQEGQIYALPTPGGLTIREGTVALLPALRPLVQDAPYRHQKYELTNQQMGNGRWSLPAPVTAIYFTEVTQQARCSRQARSDALSLVRLMEESMDRWDQGTFADHMTILQQLSQQARAYDLKLGRDVENLPKMMLTPSG